MFYFLFNLYLFKSEQHNNFLIIIRHTRQHLLLITIRKAGHPSIIICRPQHQPRLRTKHPKRLRPIPHRLIARSDHHPIPAESDSRRPHIKLCKRLQADEIIRTPHREIGVIRHKHKFISAPIKRKTQNLRWDSLEIILELWVNPIE